MANPAELYADFTTDELKGLRKSILAQRASGRLSVSYNGQAFTFSSPAQMRIVADEIQATIRRRIADENGWVPVKTTRWSAIRPLAGDTQ